MTQCGQHWQRNSNVNTMNDALEIALDYCLECNTRQKNIYKYRKSQLVFLLLLNNFIYVCIRFTRYLN